MSASTLAQQVEQAHREVEAMSPERRRMLSDDMDVLLERPRRNQIEAVKPLCDGRVLVRLVGAVRGVWLTYDSGIDSLLAHIARELCISGRGAKTVVIASLCIDHAAISRCRHGPQQIQEHWLLRAHEFTGIPIAELRQVAGIGAGIPPHKNARPSRPAAGA